MGFFLYPLQPKVEIKASYIKKHKKYKMKLLKLFTFFCITLLIVTCKKDVQINYALTPNLFSSVDDFFAKNAPPMQIYIINGSTGGSFTTTQGTIVTIPSNAFVAPNNTIVTGNLKIFFKDIYKKSDMFLSNKPATTINGAPLKSAGEFYIKVTYQDTSVEIANGKKITISQPASLTGGLDSKNKMTPFKMLNNADSNEWIATSTDTVEYLADKYMYNLYSFSHPASEGSWCNSDNSSFFSAYKQTLLTLSPTDIKADYNTQVFLVFKNISCMVHVYYSSNTFPYNYAPEGLECTLVACGVKDGKLYSSFVPITISTNKTVNFSLKESTSSEFINHLQTLN